MFKNNGVPLYAEEMKIEAIEELQEQNKTLVEENKKFRLLSLVRRKKNGELEKKFEDERRHASRMDDLYWEVLRERDGLRNELAREKVK